MLKGKCKPPKQFGKERGSPEENIPLMNLSNLSSEMKGIDKSTTFTDDLVQAECKLKIENEGIKHQKSNYSDHLAPEDAIKEEKRHHSKKYSGKFMDDLEEALREVEDEMQHEWKRKSSSRRRNRPRSTQESQQRKLSQMSTTSDGSNVLLKKSSRRMDASENDGAAVITVMPRKEQILNVTQVQDLSVKNDLRLKSMHSNQKQCLLLFVTSLHADLPCLVFEKLSKSSRLKSLMSQVAPSIKEKQLLLTCCW